jgi:hypothetical protein
MDTRIKGHSILLQICRSICVVTCLVTASVIHASDATDPCAERADIADATVVLESSRLEPSGIFVGVFRIENRNPGATRQFRALGVNGEMRIVFPERSVEYLDGIANEWRPVLDLPGSFLPRPESLVVPPGKILRFAAPLFTREVVDRGARVFRLLIRSSDPKLCFVSAPFEAYPLPPAVKGFQSLPARPDR